LVLVAPAPSQQVSARERHHMAKRMLEADELCQAGEDLRTAKQA
jgi:hypothetical protein